MADIAPLTPLRYDLARLPRGLASVVAPPYDVISPSQRAELAAKRRAQRGAPHSPGRRGRREVRRSGQTVRPVRATGVFTRDCEPAFYRLRSVLLATVPRGKAITRRGFLALVRLVPLSAGVVLPHERTLTGPERRPSQALSRNAGKPEPGLHALPRRARRARRTSRLRPALAEFSTPDGVHHALAKVTAKDAIAAIMEGVARSTLLIADGHHRYETAVRYAEEVGEGRTMPRIAGEHRYFMAFLANGDDPNLLVFPTHRLVHSLPSFSFDTMLEGAETWFSVHRLPEWIGASAALVSLKEAAKRGPSIAAAASDGRVAVFTLRADVDLAAHPKLGLRPEICDARTSRSSTLRFSRSCSPSRRKRRPPRRTSSTLQDATTSLADVRSGKGQVLFLMNATPVADVRRVAEGGEVMPQKSTFFYPKVLTGLAIHTLQPSRSVASE